MPTTSNFGWTTPADTDLVKDGAAAIRTLGNGIDTSFLDLKGGTTGQILSKASNTDLDFSWTAAGIAGTIFDAKGDLLTSTAADTPARLGVGSNGQVLTADSTTSTGLKWATPASGGKVLQVVGASTTTGTVSASSTYADTALSATITPSATSSKILVLVNHTGCGKNSNNTRLLIKLLRNTTDIAQIEGIGALTNDTDHNYIGSCSTSFLDSPSTTSAITYKTQIASNNNNGNVEVSAGSSTSTMILLEIGA